MTAQLEPRDTSYYQTLPLARLMQLWDSRVNRLGKLVGLNAPQLLIDIENQLVVEARDAYSTRTAQGEEP